MFLGLGIQEAVISQEPASPLVAKVPAANWKRLERSPGTLLLCGGGQIPLSIREEFHRLGKGEEGTLVLIPTASPRSDAGDYSIWVDYWSGFVWKKVEVVHVSSRDEVNDPLLVETLRKATAVWISGGEQQRLSDRYVGTPIEKELHAILARGGIIGGTSAGAAIASSTMISGGVTEPQFASGLQFLPNTIIDQHFSQRNRHGRLKKAVEAFPNRVGIGIDESTGLFVTQDESRVVGDGGVILLNLNARDENRRLKAGDKF